MEFNQEKYEQVMEMIAERLGDRRTSPAVAKLIPDLVGHIMHDLNSGDGLDPMGAMFALGMAANAISAVFAKDGDFAGSKGLAMSILSYAMQQTVLATETTGKTEFRLIPRGKLN